jgi:GDP-L-fucose synthase
MPEGTPRKLMDVSRINELGWRHSVVLEEGIEATYDWYTKNNQ